jgi:hypothetical protein
MQTRRKFIDRLAVDAVYLSQVPLLAAALAAEDPDAKRRRVRSRDSTDSQWPVLPVPSDQQEADALRQALS